jgi:hypothetical protein
VTNCHLIVNHGQIAQLPAVAAPCISNIFMHIQGALRWILVRSILCAACDNVALQFAVSPCMPLPAGTAINIGVMSPIGICQSKIGIQLAEWWICGADAKVTAMIHAFALPHHISVWWKFGG